MMCGISILRLVFIVFHLQSIISFIYLLYIKKISFYVFVQSHPNTKDYRHTPIPLLDRLTLTFEKNYATGKGALPPVDTVEEIDREEEEQNDEEIEVIDSQSTKKLDKENQPRKKNK